MLMRRSGMAVTYMVFDLLSFDGEDFTRAPYSERRARLEALDLNGAHWQTPEAFDAGSTSPEAKTTQTAAVRVRPSGGYLV